MSLSIIICLFSGIFWAIFDLTRKLSLRYIHPKLLLLLFTLVQILIFFFWCVKESFYFNLALYFIPGITLLIIGTFSALIFLESIKKSDLSLTIPLLSFSPLFSSLFSFIFLEEKLEFIQYFGILAVIIGTLFLYSEKFKFIYIFRSISNIKNNESAKLMLLVALCWSITPVLDKMCLAQSSINFHGFVQALFMFLILFIISLKELSNFKRLKKNNYYLIFFTILAGTIATIIQFYAILLNFVPIMESIKRAVGQFSAVLFGKLFFNEKITVQKIFGITFISFGVSMII